MSKIEILLLDQLPMPIYGGVFYHYPKTMQDNIFVLEMNKFKRLT